MGLIPIQTQSPTGIQGPKIAASHCGILFSSTFGNDESFAKVTRPRDLNALLHSYWPATESLILGPHVTFYRRLEMFESGDSKLQRRLV